MVLWGEDNFSRGSSLGIMDREKAMLHLLMLKERQAFGKCDRRVRSTRLLLLSVEDMMMMMMMMIATIIITGEPLQRGLVQKSDMDSATGLAKVWNYFCKKNLLPSSNQLKDSA